MNADRITSDPHMDPREAFPFEPTPADWAEYGRWCDYLDSQERTDNVNLELSAIANQEQSDAYLV